VPFCLFFPRSSPDSGRSNSWPNEWSVNALLPCGRAQCRNLIWRGFAIRIQCSALLAVRTVKRGVPSAIFPVRSAAPYSYCARASFNSWHCAHPVQQFGHNDPLTSTSEPQSPRLRHYPAIGLLRNGHLTIEGASIYGFLKWEHMAIGLLRNGHLTFGGAERHEFLKCAHTAVGLSRNGD
jgi:hypothetical protein